MLVWNSAVRALEIKSMDRSEKRVMVGVGLEYVPQIKKFEMKLLNASR